jgi:hypothetical protein
VQAVVEVPAAGLARRAAGGVRITALLPGVNPPAAAGVVAAALASKKALENAVSLALWLADVTALPPAVAASPSAFACASGFVLSAATETCCPARDAPPVAGVDPARVLWTNSCAWECVSPYVRHGGACLLCSERNALSPPAVSKPANAVWDDSGASQTCVGWTCIPGLIARSNPPSCLTYDEMLLRCSVYRYALLSCLLQRQRILHIACVHDIRLAGCVGERGLGGGYGCGELYM